MRRALTIVALLAAGCSAVINPDTDRLGDEPDTGIVRIDGGRTDGGRTDGGGTDAGRTDGGERTDAGADSGVECMGEVDCNDDVACTEDRCEDGGCVNTPNDGACPGGERCNAVMGCVPARCTRNEECDDGAFCNGAERCDAGAPGSGCVPGVPIVCADDYGCTTDVCNEAADRCSFLPTDSRCPDAIDCTSDRCNPAASDNPSGCTHEPVNAVCNTAFCTVSRVCNPTTGCEGGVPRVCSDATPCTVDSCHESSRSCAFVPLDADMDSYAASFASISPGGPTVSCPGTDCDDGNIAVNPGATEACNGYDDNCNGMTDEGCTTVPDTCATAAPIVLNAAGRGSARGTLSSFSDDYDTNPVCSAIAGGRDAVYYVDLPRGRNDVTIDTIGSMADTVLGVGLACSEMGLQAVCNDDYAGASGPTRDSRVWLHRVGATGGTTRIYILVDGYSGSTTGDFVVNVASIPAADDSCSSISGATPMDITGGGTVLGFQTGFIGGQRGSCQPIGDTSPEAVFRLTGPGTGNVDFSAYSMDFVPDIYLRSGMCTGSEVGCALGAAIGGGINGASLRRSVSAGTPYYFFVDGGRSVYAIYYTPR